MKKSLEQWATLIAICMAGGTIFKLAYLRGVFYVAMQEAFGFTNTQFGLMMTAFAVTQFIACLPGGWLYRSGSGKIFNSGFADCYRPLRCWESYAVSFCQR